MSASISEDLLSARDAVLREGFAILNVADPSGVPEVLLGASAVFGAVMPHPKAGPNGLVPVAYNADLAANDRFISETADALLPHTDGSFLTAPPGIVALGVVRLADPRSATYLVDAGALCARLRAIAPQILDGRAKLRINRTTDSATCQIFERAGDRFHFRFRFDEQVTATVENLDAGAMRALEHCMRHAHKVRPKLRPGSILFVDNFRMLHGRDAFEPTDDRLLLRAWYEGGPLRDRLGVPVEDTAVSE